MARDPQEDGQFSKRPNENDGLEGDGPLAEEAANVDLAERKMAEHSRLRAIEEEDEERVEGVERGEEEVGREVEGDEKLMELASEYIQGTGERARERTNGEPEPHRFDVEKDEAEARDEPRPEEGEPKEEPQEGRRGGEVTKRLRPQEPWERVPDERRVDVSLLIDEHVWD